MKLDVGEQPWKLHLCAASKICRIAGVTWRLHFNCPWFHLGVALRPKDRFAGRPGEKSRWTMLIRYETVVE